MHIEIIKFSSYHVTVLINGVEINFIGYLNIIEKDSGNWISDKGAFFAGKNLAQKAMGVAREMNGMKPSRNSFYAKKILEWHYGPLQEKISIEDLVSTFLSLQPVCSPSRKWEILSEIKDRSPKFLKKQKRLHIVSKNNQRDLFSVN
ncbi:hypothetical protein GW943_00435 [Candidatus Parcubacteria bacterium]|uniref:Uncharacterized protein n=1 Tax=Candidatus Kaiserbacteria bacterium CG10_big_fil_rev_8_21_14_0_10_47_16 TaxID=1974608 RepID=A0A2H0UD08_9BACT|nr:hypothetical protein [Candidatus Parcubacteria bacterium]PIR84313.1 MAG: hypothetical protein COU16_01820 [Candidatus Kaiserbacteria bacterium CG10_big_fil_rev_8_21_14_0_10_47_16]